MIDLDAAEALCAAATPISDWKCAEEEMLEREDDEFPRWVLPMGPRQRLDEYGDGDEVRYAQAKADARFIAAARTLLPEALRELRALRKVVWRLNGGTAGASDKEMATVAMVEIESLAAWEGEP